jgi:UDP-N-acetyl-D-glucosamine dehydrogenase
MPPTILAPSGTPAVNPLLALPENRKPTVAIIGMGYVGLPTSCALTGAGFEVQGLDVSEQRIAAIRSGDVELLAGERAQLTEALDEDMLKLSTDSRILENADAVIICVPTPVDEQLRPDLAPLGRACATAVAHAQPGQLFILTSTTYVGTTRDLVIGPLERRGFTVGEDAFCAFAPERINPGDTTHVQETTPRVFGAVTEACAERVREVLADIVPLLHQVSSPEAAELTKLYENSFRATNIALANEIAGVARFYGVDIVEITQAAATKPYGFMPHYPGPGIGGHCIGVDPYYLLHPLEDRGGNAPLLAQAMAAVSGRPMAVVDRAQELIELAAGRIEEARVLVVGVTYKPGIKDVRESCSVKILKGLAERGAQIDYHDPLVPVMRRKTDPGHLESVADPDPTAYDLVIVTVQQPDSDYSWLADCPRILDCTYSLQPVAGQDLFTV